MITKFWTTLFTLPYVSNQVNWPMYIWVWSITSQSRCLKLVIFFEFYLQFMCFVWWQSSWNGIWYLIEHSLGVVTGFGYVVVYFFRLTLELQYDMWYIISSLAIVVSLFRLHMCRFTLSMLFFNKDSQLLVFYYKWFHFFYQPNRCDFNILRFLLRWNWPFVSKREMFKFVPS